MATQQDIKASISDFQSGWHAAMMLVTERARELPPATAEVLWSMYGTLSSDSVRDRACAEWLARIYPDPQ